MRLRRTGATALFLAPLAVGIPVPHPDSVTTRFGISAGGTSYVRVIRGCEGQVLEKQRVGAGDLGVRIDHRLRGPLWIGVRAGAIWSDAYGDGGNRYLNPHLALEFRKVGLGAGPIWRRHELEDVGRESAKAPFSAHLRFGSIPGGRLSIRWLESQSLVGDGYGVVEIRGPRYTWGQMGLGLSAVGPHDTAGIFISYGWPLKPALELHASGRIGIAEGSGEFGAGLGLQYSWTR